MRSIVSLASHAQTVTDTASLSTAGTTLVPGIIGGFDKHTVLLQQPGSAQQLLYKQGIATIVPKAPGGRRADG